MTEHLPVDITAQNTAQKPPVIMQIIPELGPGGAEQGCIDVANAIQNAGGKAIVVSHGGDRVHEITRNHVTHINLPVHSKNPLTLWRNVKRLRKLIEPKNDRGEKRKYIIRGKDGYTFNPQAKIRFHMESKNEGQRTIGNIELSSPV